jgi:hypothetical protein
MRFGRLDLAVKKAVRRSEEDLMRCTLFSGGACAALLITLMISPPIAEAGTIIKLDLVGTSESSNSVDFGYDGTTLATLSDGNPLSPGDQDTAVTYQDILSGQTSLPSPQGSFSLHGLTKSGPPNLPPMTGLVIQNFTGGTFQLFGPGPAYGLLLQGSLNTSAIAGPIGAPATGGLFTSSFASITGGTLAGLLDPNNLTLSMNLNDINGSAGFVVTGSVLQPFVIDATLDVKDTARVGVPEPSTAMISLIVGLIAALRVPLRR